MLKQQATALKSWPFIPDIEKTHGLPVSLLLAVGSRETNLTNKVGDGGHGHGVWQRDDRWWPIPEGYDKDVRKQAEDAAILLAANHKALGDWAPAVAAYNAGLTGVKDAIKAGKSPDSVTAGGDYAADVLGRLAHLQAAAPASNGGASSSTGTYTVKKGDTLTSIAKAHATTVAKLVSLNGLKDADELKVGQKLKLAAAAPSAPAYEPFPGAAFFHGGRHSPLITALGRRLVALGFGQSYKSGPGPNWTNADRAAVRAFQVSKAELKGDADGIPGPKTWAALKIPKV
ncbi:peptidoglycan-binding protein [Streptomyces sp. NPDC058297]|uniref:peptidoglycan-binding protein n=1 Tax=Streptomyces sp. NPDC058297 TaxID=3346433 RepID=UPI0036E193AD